MKKLTKYNKIVNYSEDREITVLDHVFENDNFKGAVGSVFYPVSEEEIQNRIGEYEDNDKELLIYFAENFGELNREIIENIDSSRKALIELFFDLSYPELYDYMRSELNLSKDQAVIFDCVGGGRCFGKDFKGNINIELSQVIRKHES